MSKRAVLLLLSILLVLATSISGTLAFLTGEDEVVNVMTAGRVDIAQQEQQRNASGGLEPYVQNPAFLPAVYEGDAIPLDNNSANWPNADPAWQTLAENNAVVDKFVTVSNEGNVPAYVRTLVALESPGASAGGAAKWVHINHNDASASQIQSVTLVQDVAVDGTCYDVYIYTYKDPLEPDSSTIPSLKQLYLDKSCTTADMKQIGDKYEVLVLSQGVQTAGFDDAASALNQSFGQPTADRLATWLTAVVGGEGSTDQGDGGSTGSGDDTTSDTTPETPITVRNMEELNNALANVPDGGSVTIQLADSDTSYTAPANATGKTITLQGGKGASLKLVTNPNPSGPSDTSFAGSQLRLEGITVIGAKSAKDQGFACASLELVDCTIQHSMYLFAPATFTGCTFDTPASTPYHIETNGQNATFTGCTFVTYGKAIHVSSPAATHSTIRATGCTFTDETDGGVKNAVFVVDEEHTSATYQLILSDCIAIGFEDGKNTASPLWSNSDSIGKDRLSVTIDGTKAY